MWQIMWMLALLPDWIWYMLAVGGAVAVYAPLISRSIPVKIGGTAVLLLSIWMIGGISNEAKWQAKVSEMEAKVAAAEEKSKEETVKIVTKVVTKREYYKTRGNDIVQYVDREITKYDNTCPVPKEVVKAHNDAAEMKK
jgi:hypothetical protein